MGNSDTATLLLVLLLFAGTFIDGGATLTATQTTQWNSSKFVHKLQFFMHDGRPYMELRWNHTTTGDSSAAGAATPQIKMEVWTKCRGWWGLGIRPAQRTDVDRVVNNPMYNT